MAMQRVRWVELEEKEKNEFLEAFWKERVLKGKTSSIHMLNKTFLCAHPPQGWDITKWNYELDGEFARLVNPSEPLTETDFKRFCRLFDHIGSIKAANLTENLIAIERPQNSVAVNDQNVSELKQYLKDMNYTGTIVFGSLSAGQEVKFACSEGYAPSNIFTTDSITKIFTGMLCIRMLEEKIIEEQDLVKIPVEMPDDIIKLLAQSCSGEEKSAVIERLKQVSLLDLITHRAGVGVGENVGPGDFYGNYHRQVSNGMNTEIKNMREFLKFVPNQVSIQNDFNYSNTGFLLAAFVLEDLYNKKHSDKLDFNGLLKKYILTPSKMTCFINLIQTDLVKEQMLRAHSLHFAGSPAAGYYTTVEDLHKFAKWIFQEKCKQEMFCKLLKKYCHEFSKFEANLIEHPGGSPFSSSFFSLNWHNGNVVIVLNDQRAHAAVEIAAAIFQHAFQSHQVPALAIVSETMNQSTNTADIYKQMGKPNNPKPSNCRAGMKEVTKVEPQLNVTTENHNQKIKAQVNEADRPKPKRVP